MRKLTTNKATQPFLKPTPEIKARFQSFVDNATGCWLWSGCKFQDGYGVFRAHYINYRAHRASWMIYRGPIPDALCVLHRCDMPHCVKPEHLFLGTPQANTTDMMQKGRHNGAKGDTHPYAKLDSQKVRDIRVSYANGETVASLARRYAISYMTMKAVAFGWAWKHVKSLHIK